MSVFLPRELIRKKREGEELSDHEIRGFLAGVTDETIPDYQIAAMLMAIVFRGLSESELVAWTDAMLRSGDVLDLSAIAKPKVDKHSTGGVGDKISLPLAAAVAACGACVPMISGRGLGHTGGTLDKLEAIPGFRVDLPVARFRELSERVGACLVGQTERIAPADRKLYALRDVTATVESIPLIASSIMSKKLAEGIDALVLDVKVGSGAFMKTEEKARELAHTLLSIGRGAGKKVTCALTNMDQPIGRAVGNALEVEESILVLSGAGPSDTRALTVTLGAEMLVLAGLARTTDEGAARLARVLDDGSALAKFAEIVSAQGGDPRVCDTPRSILPQAPHRADLLAPSDGTLVAVDTEAVGLGALILGGGRRRKEDVVDPAVGLTLHVRLGDRLAKGQPLATVHFRTDPTHRAAAELLTSAFRISPGSPDYTPPPLVHALLR
jgi:pyrimidine-nucleoside phosphorylase